MVRALNTSVAVLLLVALAAAHERVHMRDIQALVLEKGAYTEFRRGAPVPQLKCLAAAGLRDDELPKAAMCRNIGWDGREAKWECELDGLPDTHRLVSPFQVSCEGWARSGDPHVLAGSCGLEYRLERAAAPLQRGVRNEDLFRARAPSQPIPRAEPYPDKSLWIMLSVFVVGMVTIFIITIGASVWFYLHSDYVTGERTPTRVVVEGHSDDERSDAPHSDDETDVDTSPRLGRATRVRRRSRPVRIEVTAPAGRPSPPYQPCAGVDPTLAYFMGKASARAPPPVVVHAPRAQTPSPPRSTFVEPVCPVPAAAPRPASREASTGWGGTTSR